MPENTPGENKGLLQSLSTLVATLVAIIHTRLELLSIDLEEEREHLFSLLILALVAVFLLGMGIVLVAFLLVVIYWETHRILVLSLMAGTFLILGIATWSYMIHKVRTKPRLFESSLSELDKDCQQLGSRS